MDLSLNELAELKARELSLLKEFIEVCKKLNLKYFLVEGSLLGAVRHQGFIPWDDDIDVAMYREDFETLLREGQQLLPSNCFLQTYQTDVGYAHNFAKVRDSSTTFVESSVAHQKINHGVYIDVFPLDFCYPENSWKQRLIFFLRKIVTYRISLAFRTPLAPKGIIMRGVKSIFNVIARCLLPDFTMALKVRDILYKWKRQGTEVVNYGSIYRVREIMPVAWYGDGATLSFEDIHVCVPVEYEKWLTRIYGDYMQLPPVEKRISHHEVEIVDLDHSYLEYV